MRAMSSRLSTSALILRASSAIAFAVSSCVPASAGFVISSDSANPISAASGVRTSCESADRSELRSRSDSIWISACWATST